MKEYIKITLFIFVTCLLQLTTACKNKTESIAANTLRNTTSLKTIEEINPIVLDKKGKEIFQYWEFADEAFWWQSELGSIEAIKLYQDSIKLILGSKFERSTREERLQLPKAAIVSIQDDRDKMNLDMVQKGLLGTIREMNHLESQLLNYQITKYPLFSHPTEFHGFIAKNEELNLVRVYFASSDMGWPPRPTIIIEELDKEVHNGWKLHAHLHNHYGDEERGYIGKMAPSLADAQYFMMLKNRFNIQEALITNGFTTVSISAENFEKFESH